MTLKNEEKFFIPEEKFLQLDQERPNGLTGHLRVINGELTLKECIDSALPFLDELIITYQPSKDNTEAILKDYASQYPDKIKLDCYEPFIVSSSVRSQNWGTEEEKQRNQDPQYRKTENIHNPANYYNYGYVKTSFKYYMKIDADQVYFTEKMLEIRKGLLFPLPIFKNKILRKCYRLFGKIIRRLDAFSWSTRYLPYSWYIVFYRILYNDTDLSFELGGIDSYLSNGKIQFLLEKDYKPFNGLAGDTAIFVPSSKERYFDECGKWERLIVPCNHVGMGLMWIHLGPILFHLDQEPNNLTMTQAPYQKYSESPNNTTIEKKTCSFQELSTYSYKQFMDYCFREQLKYTQEKFPELAKIFEKQPYIFWDKDRKFISKVDLSSISEKLV